MIKNMYAKQFFQKYPYTFTIKLMLKFKVFLNIFYVCKI